MDFLAGRSFSGRRPAPPVPSMAHARNLMMRGNLKNNLVVPANCEPTSASRLRRSSESYGASHAQHLHKSRYRFIHGLDPAYRFICSRRGWRRTRRRTRRLFRNGSIFATRRFGGYRKCAYQRYSKRSRERGRTTQLDGRSKRHTQCCQDDNAATAEHGCSHAAERFANSGRASADDRGRTSTSALEVAAGTHLQPRVGQGPSEKDLTNPNSPANRENAALDRRLDICRGC